MKKNDLKQLNRSELKNVFGGIGGAVDEEAVPVLTGSYACCTDADPKTGIRQCSKPVYVRFYDELECVDSGTSLTKVG
ncbi:hypothetical protein [Elizabethkingia meningoseptica]|uniref:hypothetical protein n=1 Tax=Elizabethkingia meningoseptica TaxID=238 RepID=UPI00099A2816|nr:hypothetical protein [Elizabethkingia meningoseptica]OPB98854.1 hypothetical protein BAS10_04055 [Elizabethkingia meningoseptica]